MSPDAKAIREEIRRRGITRVVHFTQSRKLVHILSSPDGILSNLRLRKGAVDVFDANDPLRLDGHLDDINCSIEGPNVWMLNKAKAREEFFEDWVIVVISPRILWGDSVEFTDYNAAGGSVHRYPGIAGFNRLFAPTVRSQGGRTRSRPASMLASSPTDDQAEVLVRGQIPRSSIEAVAVKSREAAIIERRRLSLVSRIPDVRWIVAPGLFDRTWSDSVKTGKTSNRNRRDE